MAKLKLGLLGYPLLSLNGQSIKEKMPDKALALLSYLAVTQQPQPRDFLAGLLWGNMPDDRARNNLSIVLNKLKKIDGMGDYLQVSRREIALRPSDPATMQLDCDVVEFERLATRPQQRTLDELEAAAALYGGRFLQGFRPNDEDGTRVFIEWKHNQQTRLEGLALELFAPLIQRCADARNLIDAIAHAKRQLAINPWQESAHRQLMLLLAQNGQKDLALAQYRACRKMVVDEFDVEPEQETMGLYEDIVHNRIPVWSEDPPEMPLGMPLRPYDDIIGRDEGIDELAELLSVQNGNWLVNLNGLGGIGKTSLAYATLRHLIFERRIEKVAWIDIDADKSQEGGLSSKALLEMIVNQLIGELPSIEHHAPSHEQRLRQIKLALRQEPYLVVIDNIETFSDDGSLSEQLYELAKPSRFLLVSRPQLVAIRPIQSVKLAPLGQEDTVEFVRKRAISVGLAEILASTPESLVRLYRLVGGHPQALQLFMQCAAYFSAESILDEFESAEVTDMDMLYADIYERVWQTQSKDARQLLDAMRLAPTSGISDTLLQAYSGLNKTRLWKALMSLVDASLLIRQSWTGEMNYHIHSLTDSFLQSRDHQQLRSQEAQAWHIEQIAEACAYWQAQVKQITTSNFSDFHPLLVKLVGSGLRRPETWLISAELMLSLYFQIQNSVQWSEWHNLHQIALQYAADNELPTQYRLYSRLATLTYLTNDYSEAAQKHHQALDLAQSLDDLKGIGREHMHLGIANRSLGNYLEAAQHGERALDIFQQLQLNGHFLATALNSLGQNSHAQAGFLAANDYFAQAIRVDDGTIPDVTRSRIYQNGGDALRYMQQFDEAQEKYERAFDLIDGFQGDLNSIQIATSQCNLYLDRDDLQAAQTLITNPLFKHTFEWLPLIHAAAIARVVGRFHILQRDFESAIHHLKFADKYTTGVNNEAQSADCYLLLAWAYLSNGNKAQAELNKRRVLALMGSDLMETWVQVFIGKYELTNLFDDDQ